MPGKKFTKEERIWNYIQYGARQHILRDLRDADLNQIENKSEEEKKRILEANKQKRIKQGFPAKVEIAKDVERMEDYILDDIKKMIIGKASEEDLTAGFQMLGRIAARINVEYGKEHERIHSRFGEGKNTYERAAIIAGKSQCKATHIEAQMSNLKLDAIGYVAKYMDDGDVQKYLKVFDKACDDARETMSPEDQKYFDAGAMVKAIVSGPVEETYPQFMNNEYLKKMLGTKNNPLIRHLYFPLISILKLYSN